MKIHPIKCQRSSHKMLVSFPSNLLNNIAPLRLRLTTRKMGEVLLSLFESFTQNGDLIATINYKWSFEYVGYVIWRLSKKVHQIEWNFYGAEQSIISNRKLENFGNFLDNFDEALHPKMHPQMWSVNISLTKLLKVFSQFMCIFLESILFLELLHWIQLSSTNFIMYHMVHKTLFY